LQSLAWRNGSITVGGRPLREIDLKWWRTQIGLVQQEPCLFNNTIYANVEFGLVGTQWEDSDLETKKQLVKQACIEAFADEFISRLPDVSPWERNIRKEPRTCADTQN
jgi:ABC-type multidrug transport system fused ATPase/permease subunit